MKAHSSVPNQSLASYVRPLYAMLLASSHSCYVPSAKLRIWKINVRSPPHCCKSKLLGQSGNCRPKAGHSLLCCFIENMSYQENDHLNLDDLIRTYLRFKEWMDYDAEHSAYSAKEIIVMRKLFGTAYVTVPADLVAASHEKLLNVMDKRISDMQALAGAIDSLADESVTNELLKVVDETSFQSSAPYFTTLFQGLWQTIRNAGFDIESGQDIWTVDHELVEDYYDEVEKPPFEEIRTFIISEHPRIESVCFSREKLYALGLPKQSPDPIPYVVH